jgi:hypothetical protein
VQIASSNHTDPAAWPANYYTMHVAKKDRAEGLDAPWIETSALSNGWPHAASEDDQFRQAESPFDGFLKSPL